MRRTQLYLDDDLWSSLHSQAKMERTTISDLVRKAIRERYLGRHEDRKKVMSAFVGVWKDRADLSDSEEFIRSLRRGSRRDETLRE